SRTQYPVFAPWHAYAALPQKEFASRAAEVTARLTCGPVDPKQPLNPLVKAAFQNAPSSMREVAQRYAQVFADADRPWRIPLAHRGPEEEALRRVLQGSASPFAIATTELRAFLNRAERDKLTALRRRVDQWQATSPAAPARAMVLEDSPRPSNAHVF